MKIFGSGVRFRKLPEIFSRYSSWSYQKTLLWIKKKVCDDKNSGRRKKEIGCFDTHTKWSHPASSSLITCALQCKMLRNMECLKRRTELVFIVHPVEDGGCRWISTGGNIAWASTRLILKAFNSKLKNIGAYGKLGGGKCFYVDHKREVLCQNTSYLGLNLPVRMWKQLYQFVVELRRNIQHDLEEAVLFLPKFISHLFRGSPGLQVPYKC